MKNILLIISSLFLTMSVAAQDETEANTAKSTGGTINPQFSCNYMHGKLINIIDLDDLNGSNYIQLCATMSTGTQDGSFFNYFKKPQVGFTALAGWIGKRETLGSTIALYPTWRYSFFESKTIGCNVVLGTGFAWFTKPYDKHSNTENLYIGSHLTSITEAGLNIWFKFLPQWKAQAGASFLHFSNGHTSIPNYGINDVTAKIGILYEPGIFAGRTTKVRTLPKMDSTWNKTVMFSLGRHQLARSAYPVDGPRYNVYKISGYVSKRLTNINEVQFGASFAFYESYYNFIHLTDYYGHLQVLGATQLAVHVGHEFLINRFGFNTDLGIKILDPFYRSYMLGHDKSLWHKSVLSPKIGFKFYPIWNSFADQKLALGMYIKANGVQADYVEYSLSFTF